MTAPEEEQRVQEAVRRHARNRAFAEAEQVISLVLADPQVRQAREHVEAAETQLGTELCARLQPFQDRYDQAVRDGNAARLTGIYRGKHGRWGTDLCPGRRARDLDGGTALGPQQRGAADRLGRQRTRRLVSGGETGDRTPGAGRPGVLRCPGPSAPRARSYTHWSAMPGVLSCGIALECV
ncbi:hypothetical protein GCM10018793_69920 [Streptomyces sulfonofaciens]|uniref:Uncharacterized protein n=1 Tax=Streptomyces sulfonofaciens TaxID=68272 RepID=A0A919GQD6_9ACTN|nr:hypothetical protein GCM10018793_69920 [Streptomyces sulfonofaciens]